MDLHIPAFLNYHCLACSACCRHHEIALTDAEHERLARVDWPKLDAEVDMDDPFARARARAKDIRRCMALREDGSCAFLAGDAKCIIHKHLGYDAKSLTCRLYPVSLVKTPSGWYAGGRFNCKALAEGAGPPLENSRPMLKKLCRELEASGRLITFGDTVRFDAKQTLDWAQYLYAERALINLILRPDLPLLVRVVGAWRVVDLMQQATMAKVGDRFEEFIDLVVAGVVRELEEDGPPHTPPGRMERWMFHQLLFLLHRRYGVHAGSPGFFRRLFKRVEGARAAWRFGMRRGRVTLFADRDPVRLKAVDRVHLPPLDHAAEAALERYLAAKLFGKQIFGPMFFGYAFVRGFTALFCGFAAVLWFARARALADDRAAVATGDVIDAIRHVDFSLGHSPALAMPSERLRLDWLGREDTPARIAVWQMMGM